MTKRAKTGAGSKTGPAARVAARRSTPVVVVTGMSGAGRSTALKVLEDLGYEAVDNMPLHLFASLIRPGSGFRRPLAIGVDVRTRDFDVSHFVAAIDHLRAEGDLAVRTLFLDCDDNILRRRYTETRRRHPLAADRPLADGIRHERWLVSPLKKCVDVIIDTSGLAPGKLRHLLKGNFGIEAEPGVTIFVTSFSYRHGLPREGDLVFDVRFLANPHYDPALQPLTGRDARVADFVAADPCFAPFFEALKGLLLPLLPRFEREGRSYLTIALGCTGGRHRSVFVAERLASLLREQGGRVTLHHRDIDRPANP
jgi:UPF0042 nucleotide-binding protein